MELHNDAIREIAQATSVRGQIAPRPVFWSLATLTQGQALAHVIAESSGASGSCTWRVVALTDRHIITIHASAPVEAWAFVGDDAGNPEGMELSASAVPRSALTRVEITDAQHAGAWSSDNGEWSAHWVVHADGVPPIALPSSGKAAADPADAMALELLAAL